MYYIQIRMIAQVEIGSGRKRGRKCNGKRSEMKRDIVNGRGEEREKEEGGREGERGRVRRMRELN